MGVLRANEYSTLNKDSSILIISDEKTIINTYVNNLLLATENLKVIY